MLQGRAGHAHAVAVSVTDPKESAWWKPALSFFVAGAKALIVIATMLIVLIAGWLTWWWYRPDLFFNPIGRFVHIGFLDCRDRGQCPVDGAGWDSMVPHVFTVGEPHDQVAQRLRDAGFSEWIVDQDEEIYRLSGAATTPFPCSRYYNVRVTFDESKGLETAESTFSGTPSCL
jgi:hypothetical protein